MPFGLGFGELVIILLIVTVVFGATKLPQLGDGLGKAIKNFKRSVGPNEDAEEKSKLESRESRDRNEGKTASKTE